MQKVLWRELRGLLIIAAALLLGLSLLSYHPTDRSLMSVSTHPTVSNLIGRAGAAVADGLFQLIGVSAYLLPIFGAMIGWRWFWMPTGRLPRMQLAGWGLLAVSLMPFAAMLLPRLPLLTDRAIVDGQAGGWIGGLLAQWADLYIGRLGGVILLTTTLLASVTLITAASLPALLSAAAHIRSPTR